MSINATNALGTYPITVTTLSFSIIYLSFVTLLLIAACAPKLCSNEPMCVDKADKVKVDTVDARAYRCSSGKYWVTMFYWFLHVWFLVTVALYAAATGGAATEPGYTVLTDGTARSTALLASVVMLGIGAVFWLVIAMMMPVKK